jgi:fumarylacetoacetate (FAA) hydrolase family protein
MVAAFTVEQTSRAQKQLLKAMNALRDFRTLAGRRSVLTLPRVLEETAADNAARATEVDDLAGVQP